MLTPRTQVVVKSTAVSASFYCLRGPELAPA
jgi:hypothetical protein